MEFVNCVTISATAMEAVNPALNSSITVASSSSFFSTPVLVGGVFSFSGKLEDILADRVGSFVNGLRAPNASSTPNLVHDVDESEFRRACVSCGSERTTIGLPI